MTLNYFQNIPNASNNPSQDQPNMKTNTNSEYAIWTYDHFTYGSPINGQHKWVTFATNNVPAVPTSPPVLFTNINSVTGLSELYFYSGTAAQSSNQYVPGSQGSTFLFGGTILKWGNVTATSGIQVNFASPFPNNCYAVTIAGSDASKVTVVTTFNKTGFDMGLFAGGSTTFSYIAIGN